MSDDTKDSDLPETFTMPSHCYEAARRGMTLKTIAARSGRTLAKFNELLLQRPEMAVQLQLAFGEWEEKQREEIEAARQDAIAQGLASLRYKIARENVREMVDRDATVRAIEVNAEDNGDGTFSLSMVLAKANRDPNTGVTLSEPTITPLNPEKGSEE